MLPLVGWIPILSEVSREELEDARMPSMTHLNAMLHSNLAMLQEVFMSTMRTTCMIMFILMAAFTLQFAFAYLRISHALADLVVSHGADADGTGRDTHRVLPVAGRQLSDGNS